MSISYVQGAAGANIFSLTTAAQFDYATHDGCLITVSLAWNSGTETIVSVTDNVGNTYQPAEPIQKNAAGDRSRQIWYAYDCTGDPSNDSHTVTATLSNSNGWLYVAIQEWTGLTGGFDPFVASMQHATLSTASPYNYALGYADPTAAGDLVYLTFKVSELRDFDAWTWDDVWHAMKGAIDGAYIIATGTARVSPTMSLDGDAEVYGTTAVFRAAPPAPLWVPVAEWHAHAVIDAAQYPGGTARCRCALWTADTGGSPLPTVQARLVSLAADGTPDATVGTSDVIQATEPTDATFQVSVSGIKAYRLELTSYTTGVDLFCAPGAKVVP